jgi:hypothetical protein
LTFWRRGWTLVRFIFIFYFVRLSLCIKYSDYIVTFISIHSVIICVVFFGAYMRCTRLCPLNPGVIRPHHFLLPKVQPPLPLCIPLELVQVSIGSWWEGEERGERRNQGDLVFYFVFVLQLHLIIRSPRRIGSSDVLILVADGHQ